ncbi:DJ-1/PfpI family protein [Legionella spiritensis]|uniref:4-methyl-5(B-hydroxyethyl)-thiazole monophosphate biosynthesis enzyme n=1 Tax=Legionella spiritensis TaxID=452 RepID=A0A0W0YZ40_LEGSP|nr:DJ-1/PfpI family protein [Legionella spiritensis]KTD62161.1 4-methyl-5(B-hydroxyethyl)-thiazole monophosphate biosynthesis enzyme [Legionella spiritensis]SNV29473.1 4-methyl-5(B-hydroxyethyl)-thiazole monophosphate biosynthesis enzyme [Legionella spiritensis]
MHITFLFYEGMTALDAIGPHEILSRLPNASVKRVALNSGNICTCSDLILTADYTLSDVSQTDILVIPGAGNATALREYPDILEWVKDIHASTIWTTSVCTGSLILGAAGLLSGVKATTHWAVMERLKKWNAIPTFQRVVESGKIMTAAGVSAGIDMALTLAAKISGEDIAQTLQLGLEYDPQPPFNSGSPDKASPQILKNLQARLSDRFEAE